MTRIGSSWSRTALVVLAVLAFGAVFWQRARLSADPPPNSYAPVVMQEDFDKVMAKMSAAKPEIMARQMKLLEERYDLSDRPAEGVTMSRGKAVQEGVRAKLPADVKSWEELAAMSPEDIKEKGLWPQGFLPLPHPNHSEGGMVFPKQQIDEVKKQEGRDLSRFDLDFDLPTHLMPEYPPAIFLTTRPDLGDVSQGQVVTLANYFKLFNGLLNPKQLEGLRLLVTPFPQQQFNATDDRRSISPARA